MNKKLLITIGYSVSVLATVIGIITAMGATSPDTITRATTVAIILGVFGIASFLFVLVSKE